MRKLLLLLLLFGVFIGGYYTGRLNGAPDLLAWTQKAVTQSVARTREFIATLNSDQDPKQDKTAKASALK